MTFYQPDNSPRDIAAREEQNPQRDAALPARSSGRILLVDDSLRFAAQISSYLESALGRPVVHLRTVEEVIELFSAPHDIFVALVDGNLGDGRADEYSLSGEIVNDILRPRGIPFVRISSNPTAIPDTLIDPQRGKWSKFDYHQDAFLSAVLPGWNS